jgi:hypothetical protein
MCASCRCACSWIPNPRIPRCLAVCTARQGGRVAERTSLAGLSSNSERPGVQAAKFTVKPHVVLLFQRTPVCCCANSHLTTEMAARATCNRWQHTCSSAIQSGTLVDSTCQPLIRWHTTEFTAPGDFSTPATYLQSECTPLNPKVTSVHLCFKALASPVDSTCQMPDSIYHMLLLLHSSTQVRHIRNLPG